MELSVSSPSIEAWEAPPAEAAPVLMPMSLGLDISAASPAIGSYMLWRMLPEQALQFDVAKQGAGAKFAGTGWLCDRLGGELLLDRFDRRVVELDEGLDLRFHGADAGAWSLDVDRDGTRGGQAAQGQSDAGDRV